MLSEEHISVAEMCKEFSDSEVAIGAAARDKDHTYPKELVSRMADLGLMGVAISSNYGGSDMDYVSYAIAVEGISYIVLLKKVMKY
jgi:alkylation response protein AidB-like acyl-CoA dehydrogenase